MRKKAMMKQEEKPRKYGALERTGVRNYLT